ERHSVARAASRRDPAKLLRPVRKRQAQPMDIRMAGAKLRLEDRNLLAAASDSYCRLSAFVGDLFEGAPVAVQFGLLARERLPALDDHVYVLRIELDAQTHALGQFRGRQGGPTAQEWLVDQFASLGMVQDRATY